MRSYLLMTATSTIKSILTSVGPAYIMGEGNMATTVDAGSSTLSSNMAACCCILTGRGTSSSLVHPPRGCKSSVGFLYPFSSMRLLVSCISNACPLWIGLRSWKAKTASA